MRAALALMLVLGSGCRHLSVDVRNSNGSEWRVRATALVWDSSITSLVLDGVGVVSGYRGKADAESLKAVAEAAVTLGGRAVLP